MAEPILEMRGMRKTFHGVTALSNVNLTVQEGQIHAVVGENGAGKSTLMKVLSGVYPHGDYEGTIRYQGEECRFRGIQDSEEKGIIIIHQELALVPLLSITENIFLGNEQAKGGVIDWNASYVKTQALLNKVGLKESPNTLITNLGVGKQQLIEIAKALSKEVKLLILDEALTALDPSLRAQIVNLLLELQQNTGLAYLLITNHLRLVKHIADDLLVLHQGKALDYGNTAHVFKHAEHDYSRKLINSAIA